MEGEDVDSVMEGDGSMANGRNRTLTQQGRTMYESIREGYLVKLDKQWSYIRETFSNSQTFSGDVKLLEKHLSELKTCQSQYENTSSEYHAFLVRANCEESHRDQQSHEAVEYSVLKFISDIKVKLDKLILQKLDQQSSRSVRSNQSRRSGTNLSSTSIEIIIARKRAEAESAKVGLEYTRREANLMKKRLEMEAELHVLKQEKEIAMTEMEVKVLEEASNSIDRDSHTNLNLPGESPAQRTERYVQSIEIEQPYDRHDADNIHAAQDGYLSTHAILDAHSVTHLGPDARLLTHTVPGDHTLTQPVQREFHHHSASAPQVNPTGIVNHTQPLNPSATAFEPASELSRFLLKKDLLLSRLTSFNDRPESYALWKASFRSIVSELHVNSVEELDLLVKWLGPESTRYAQSLRSANVHNPGRGLQSVWDRLEECYGCPEKVEAALKTRLSNFPKIGYKDHLKLYELSDLLAEIECVKANEQYKYLLAYFDSSSGVIPIVNKLPHGIQDKWTNHAFRYKEKHSVPFPPFSEFVKFVRNTSKLQNDPSFKYDNTSVPAPNKGRQDNPNRTRYHVGVQSRRTDVNSNSRFKNLNTVGESQSVQTVKCPIHQTRHSLLECKEFLHKPYEDKKDFLRNHGICYRCCHSNQHLAKSCSEKVCCDSCGSNRHPTILHLDETERKRHFPVKAAHGGEDMKPAQNGNDLQTVSPKCTQVCGSFQGKSCAKNLLVLAYPKGQRHKAVRMYATIDDQSNFSLCKPELFDIFSIKSQYYPYTLTSCSGRTEVTGRRAENVIVESLDGNVNFELPTLTECDHIPDIREEIPTPEIANHHAHLRDIAMHIPPLDENAPILLLIGRDLSGAHHVLDQRTGNIKAPFAQRLPLGWAIIGQVCLGDEHPPQDICVNKLFTHSDGRTSMFEPCPNGFKVQDGFDPIIEESEDSIFQRTRDDDRPGSSVEDREFLDIMAEGMQRNSEGNWVAPLPFKSQRKRLPNNKFQAFKRAKVLERCLKGNPEKRKHFVEFMQKIFSKGQAEEAPPLGEGQECWYLPIFGVYHSKKPSQIRVVFDSSAECESVSLNSVLLQGPDLTNDLLGILLRFRREPIGIMADIQQMFHCFQVSEEHRDYLRFWWYKDNDLDQELVEYRMKVHVFGNKPSPAVATYGLRKAAEAGEEGFGFDTRELVDKDFYVDDAVTSLPTVDKAVDLLKRTQASLQSNGNLRLHKIVSNSPSVMEAFPAEDLNKDLGELDLRKDLFPLQRSLGMLWDVNSDMFIFHVSSYDRPYTKRGILSVVNSIFDPMGLIAPVVVEGRCILRDLISEGVNWDAPLSPEYHRRWDEWKYSLQSLEQLQIPRTILMSSFSGSENKQLHVYVDASERIIAASSYIKCVSSGRDPFCGFVLGKAKVAPNHGHTVPRLELCAAVLGVDIAILATRHLDMDMNCVQYHTDSRIVLGYINNRTKRFSVYVTNRVGKIRKYSSPAQWTHVATSVNPADQATRPLPAASLDGSSWLVGPPITPPNPSEQETEAPLDMDMKDIELQSEVRVMTTSVDSQKALGSYRFERFSKWNRLVKSIASLKAVARLHQKSLNDCEQPDTKHPHMEAEMFVIREVQQEVYRQEFACIMSKSALPKNSPIISLTPEMDADGMLRVRGRLSNSQLSAIEKHPLIIPGKHHISTLLVRFYHEKIHHQGRHFTEGAIRAAGLWVTGVKRLISSVLHHCVVCRKLRGKQEQQIMADLPQDRVLPSPPFTNVGVDTFGPWTVVTRRTRGGQSNSKRWALLFTCLATRAVHIEIIEEMSSSSFINALRRFIALRGNVRVFRSDRGSNFIGATEALGVQCINVEDQVVQTFLNDNQSYWLFNSPHSSHMGGVWERMIGLVRRILDHMMQETSHRNLTHEVLTTFMCEVCAIINGRPLVPVSSDSDEPFILTPSTLLTQKSNHVVEPLKGYSGSRSDLYHKQWKQVQLMADTFWQRWKKEYLQSLQSRRKWTDNKVNIGDGDIVLLRDVNLHRNEWPTGRVINAIQSSDGKVRKATVRVVSQDP